MLAGSGRQKGGEWEEVDILENDKSKAACKYCIQIISAKIERENPQPKVSEEKI